MRSVAVLRVWGVVVAGMVACSDATDPGSEAEPTGVEFSTGGDVAFSAAGLPELTDGRPAAADFAVAFADSLGGLVIAGFELVDGTRGNLFVLQLADVATGEFGPCGIGADCHGSLLIDMDSQNVTVVREFWALAAGGVTVSSVAEGRVSGSFEGFQYLGPNQEETILDMGDGSFDVPLLDEETSRLGMECFLVRVNGGTCARRSPMVSLRLPLRSAAP